MYFCLRRWKVEKITVQNIMLTLAAIYLLCWLYSLYKMPEMIFGMDRDGEYGEITERGFYRLFIPGNVSAVLSFYFLGEFLYKRKKIGLCLSLAMLIVVILHVGRQMIAWTIIMSVIMVFAHYRKRIGYLLMACIVGCCCLIVVEEHIPAVSAMIELSNDQSEEFEDDIRVEASEYFLFDYPRNPITLIFGNGVPAKDTQLFLIKNRGEDRGYYQTDVGFLAMFCNYGLWGVVLCLLLLWRIIKIKVEPGYEYFRYYLLFIFGTYLMSQALTSNMFTVMMAYYVLEKSAQDRITNNRIRHKYENMRA